MRVQPHVDGPDDVGAERLPGVDPGALDLGAAQRLLRVDRHLDALDQDLLEVVAEQESERRGDPHGGLPGGPIGRHHVVHAYLPAVRQASAPEAERRGAERPLVTLQHGHQRDVGEQRRE